MVDFFGICFFENIHFLREIVVFMQQKLQFDGFFAICLFENVHFLKIFTFFVYFRPMAG